MSLYDTRWEIERYFSLLKDNHWVEEHRRRGLAKVDLHVTLAILMYQAMASDRMLEDGTEAPRTDLFRAVYTVDTRDMRRAYLEDQQTRLRETSWRNGNSKRYQTGTTTPGWYQPQLNFVNFLASASYSWWRNFCAEEKRQALVLD